MLLPNSLTECTLGILLAGGTGYRLQPLTLDRAKPAVPFGGKYRLIDFPLSNCLHSGLKRLLVLTQYKSLSLHEHLRNAWSIFNSELGEYITTVPPQMRLDEDWYQGTADSVYQNLHLVHREWVKYVVVLMCDHIYRMDYASLIDQHVLSNADLTIACVDTDLEKASAFGVIEEDAQHNIVHFHEKPEQPTPSKHNPHKALTSMGVYVFSVDVLFDALEQDKKNPGSSRDFARDVIPTLIKSANVKAYPFAQATGRVQPDGYWRDIATVEDYYEANMELLQPDPPLNVYQKDWPIRTYQAQTPPARSVTGKQGATGCFIDSICAGGVLIAGGFVEHSILSPRVLVEENAHIKDCILLDGVHVGPGAKLNKCIVDKDVHIPARIEIGLDPISDGQRFKVGPSGIIVIPKNTQFQ